MSKFLFEGGHKNKSGTAMFRLILFYFIDEDNVHFIYSPHLDLTGYGHNEEEAKESFKIVYTDFIDYTLNKKTLGSVLQKLGWQIKGSLKKPKKVTTPSMSSIQNKEYVSDIFDNYKVSTFHKEVAMPAYA